MTASSAPAGAAPTGPGLGLFALAVFASAALVFTVEPMIAKMILPRLGGSTAVWNTSLAFFQAALLAGYAYAHWLQRIASLRRQMLIHLAVLAASAMVLPLRISGALGDPSATVPALWLLGVLILSLGAPFAALSATAPLVQAWHARVHPEAMRDPYRLYAASNLGSLLALLAYPSVIEPIFRLGGQSVAWSLAYAAFVMVMAALAAGLWRWQGRRPAQAAATVARAPWRDRLVWLLLAAAPSSLLLGVTGHLTSDVASAPFLWVAPLAFYLLTFIIAFQSRPLIAPGMALMLQAAFPAGALVLAAVPSTPLALQFGVHLAGFFFTALVCAQALAARRPPAAQLTEFYLWMSIGGVVGGAFNAFVAPLIFSGVWEYPIVLVLACLARPWGRGRLEAWQWACLAVGLACAALLLTPIPMPQALRLSMLFVPALCALALARRAVPYAGLLAAVAMASYLPNLLRAGTEQHRSFFGVIQLAEVPTPVFGAARIMVHGSTLHGSQSLDPATRCQPTTYYAPATPIGQVMRLEQARRPAMTIGAVGLGTGAIASYVRRSDRLRFFEIDPLVVRLAFDPARFTYVKGCAKGPINLTLGDARLSLERTPSNSFDVLLVDAFASDSVPTHLMTVEAVRTYLRVIKPGGVVILHLSNRNLELAGPAAAAVKAAGGVLLEQGYYSVAQQVYVEASSQALVVAHDPRVLDPYRMNPAWTGPTHKARAWTDDYTNVVGALLTRLKEGRSY